jgi:hypothetical protein
VIITLATPTATIPARLPYPGAAHVDTDATCACGEPLKVHGANTTTDHDTITAPARCICCGAHVGTLTVTLDTLFGVEEDRAVLMGRCRVY